MWIPSSQSAAPFLHNRASAHSNSLELSKCLPNLQVWYNTQKDMLQSRCILGSLRTHVAQVCSRTFALFHCKVRAALASCSCPAPSTFLCAPSQLLRAATRLAACANGTSPSSDTSVFDSVTLYIDHISSSALPFEDQAVQLASTLPEDRNARAHSPISLGHS